MKKITILIALFANCLTLGAQQKVKEVVSDSYNRNGLSVIVVTRGDGYDSQILNFAGLKSIDEKFDVNPIPTQSVSIRKDRSFAITQAEADSLIASANVAKQVLSFIYNRKEDGSMDDELLRSRGLYNAKDQDIINLAASKVNEQNLAWGEKLVDASYVVLLDFVNINKPDNSDSYALNVVAYAYKMDCTREKLDDFYTAAWVESSDDQQKKAAANNAFDAMELSMIPVSTVKASSNSVSALTASIPSLSFKKAAANQEEQSTKPTFSENSVESAANNAYMAAITKLENAIPAWQVAVSIFGTKPLVAKIGKKEGLSNGKRFRSYMYTEDKEGNLVSRKRGYLRATKVTDNRGNATGATEPSEFYQISGVSNIQEGWTIKQKNDIKLGAALTARYGGFTTLAAKVDFDYLINI